MCVCVCVCLLKRLTDSWVPQKCCAVNGLDPSENTPGPAPVFFPPSKHTEPWANGGITC